MIRKIAAASVKQAGAGFLSGQGIAIAGSLYHAWKHAPEGTKISDALNQFKKRSRDDGVKMATWAVVNGALDPALVNIVPNEQMRTVIAGAATGAVMTIRNGIKRIAVSALSGGMQNLVMNLFGSSVELALKPIDNYQVAKMTEKFVKDRGEAVFKPPATAIASTFLEK